jgi:ligand-binding sensor domain-containing protein
VKRWLLAASALVAAVPARAAAETRAITAVDDARACALLASGRLAVATGGGLAIVGPGGARRVLTSLDGLPETRAHAVVEQGDGVWVGTETGAAFVSLAGGGARVTRSITREVGDAPVQAVHVAADGTAYFGTRGAGVFRLASPSAAPERLHGAAPGTRVAAIAELQAATYVAYADGPVARLEGGELRALAGSPTHGQALAAVEGALVVGDLEGIFRYEPPGRGSTDGRFRSLSSADARGLASYGGSLLAATYGDGLEESDAPGRFRAAPGVPPLTRSVAVRGSSRCVATADGVFVAAGAEPFRRVPLEAEGLPSNDASALAVSDGGAVAVGTFDSGAALWTGDRFERVPGVDATETINGAAWQGDRLWLATVHGLVRVDGGRAHRIDAHDGLPSSIVRTVLVLADGRVLAGTEAGPAWIDGDRARPLIEGAKHGGRQPLASPMHATWALAAAPDGTLYVGTASGLYYGRDGRYERASLAHGELADDWVTALAVDGRDVYVGTYSKGVTRLRFQSAGGRPAAEPLGGGFINAEGLVVSGGRLYAATMDGLLLHRLEGTQGDWEALKAASPGRDVTAVRFAGGRMWIASRRGIAVTR